jgi:hypothetical protein
MKGSASELHHVLECLLNSGSVNSPALVIECGFNLINLHRAISTTRGAHVHPTRQKVTNNLDSIRVSLLEGANFDTFGRQRNVCVWIAFSWCMRSSRWCPAWGSCLNSASIVGTVDDIERRAYDLIPSTFRIGVGEGLIKEGIQKSLSLATSAFLRLFLDPGSPPVQEVAPFPEMVFVEGYDIPFDLANIVVAKRTTFSIATVDNLINTILALLESIPDILSLRLGILVHTRVEPSMKGQFSFSKQIS